AARRRHGESVDDADPAQHLEPAEEGEDDQEAQQRHVFHGRLISQWPHDAAARLPIDFIDSSRSDFHSRAVIWPNSVVSMPWVSRSRAQPVSITSIRRPGRADMMPMRSA